MRFTQVAGGGPSRGRATTRVLIALVAVFALASAACAAPDGAGSQGPAAHADQGRNAAAEDAVEREPEGRPDGYTSKHRPPRELEDDIPELPGPASPTAERPVRVLLPAIGVDASVIGLALQDDGTIEVPPDGVDAGWFQDGARPGEPGPTVIGAHVDWDGAAAVFADLDKLSPGDVVTVQDAAGHRVDYRIDGSEQHRKDELPTFEIYGVTAEDTLRLVTCAGPFDRAARSHRDNLVVFATAID